MADRDLRPNPKGRKAAKLRIPRYRLVCLPGAGSGGSAGLAWGRPGLGARPGFWGHGWPLPGRVWGRPVPGRCPAGWARLGLVVGPGWMADRRRGPFRALPGRRGLFRAPLVLAEDPFALCPGRRGPLLRRRRRVGLLVAIFGHEVSTAVFGCKEWSPVTRSNDTTVPSVTPVRVR